MKKYLFIFSLTIFSLMADVYAEIHFGLGKAAAKQASKAVEEQRSKDNQLNLPACTGEEYSVSPIDLATTFHLEPLGHMSGVGGHLFPTDHIYFYVLKSTSATPTYNIYAPGDMAITSVASYRYNNANPVFTDYSLRFSPCQGLSGFYYHMGALSAELEAKIGAINGSCYNYTDGSITLCSKDIVLYVKAGDLLGTLIGKVGNSFTVLDFGAYDHNKPALGFISPARYANQNERFTRCPVEPFTDPVKSMLTARFGKYDGTVLRTTPPVCGEIMYDVAGTAQGLWYVAGTPMAAVSDLSPHLALVPDNVLPSTGVFSVGNSMSASSLVGTQYYFQTVNGAGLVNRDFDEITSDGNIYCYDNFQNLINSIILLQLPTSTTLKIERQTAASCGAGPWSFTNNASNFER
ncbi:MAG: hypothetical protein ACKVQC_07700 [Elusimicrobiota bacterium]